MNLYYYILFWICIIGLCFGSFYNVVIIRSLSEESIIFPASKCPKCGHKLFWWHNIPIISYLILKGKCFFCKEKISIQYPIIELITMILFAGSFIKFGLSVQTIFMIIWLSLLLIMTATDLKERLVDCNLAIFMAITGILYNGFAYGWNGILYSVLGVIAGALIIEIIARIGFLFAKTRAMGEADTYVAGAIGAIVGLQNVLYVLLAGFVSSLIFIIPMFLYNKFKSKEILTCILSVLFIASILIHSFLIQNVFSYSFLALSGILLAFSIMKNIKNNENRCYLPYVPALAAGFLWWIFV